MYIHSPNVSFKAQDIIHLACEKSGRSQDRYYLIAHKAMEGRQPEYLAFRLSRGENDAFSLHGAEDEKDPSPVVLVQRVDQRTKNEVVEKFGQDATIQAGIDTVINRVIRHDYIAKRYISKHVADPSFAIRITNYAIMSEPIGLAEKQAEKEHALSRRVSPGMFSKPHRPSAAEQFEAMRLGDLEANGLTEFWPTTFSMLERLDRGQGGQAAPAMSVRRAVSLYNDWLKAGAPNDVYGFTEDMSTLTHYVNHPDEVLEKLKPEA